MVVGMVEGGGRNGIKKCKYRVGYVQWYNVCISFIKINQQKQERGKR
jgi:hypothetical protein